jgi:hypothetical protein
VRAGRGGEGDAVHCCGIEEGSEVERRAGSVGEGKARVRKAWSYSSEDALNLLKLVFSPPVSVLLPSSLALSSRWCWTSPLPPCSTRSPLDNLIIVLTCTGPTVPTVESHST